MLSYRDFITLNMVDLGLGEILKIVTENLLQKFFLKIIVTILPHLLYHLLFTFTECLLFYHGLYLLVISNLHPNHRWHQSYFNNKGAKALRDKADNCIFCLFFSLEEYPRFPLENSYCPSMCSDSWIISWL